MGHADAFEVFVLSDTTNPAVYVHETAALHALREALGERMRVWYRHRSENVGKKSGNLRDFVTRWGRYDFMIVLDADSILGGYAVTLVREMVADPKLALADRAAALRRPHAVARLQQFAGAVYGPIVARHCVMAGRRRELLGSQRDRPGSRVRRRVGSRSSREGSRSAG